MYFYMPSRPVVYWRFLSQTKLQDMPLTDQLVAESSVCEELFKIWDVGHTISALAMKFVPKNLIQRCSYGTFLMFL